MSHSTYATPIRKRTGRFRITWSHATTCNNGTEMRRQQHCGVRMKYDETTDTTAHFKCNTHQISRKEGKVVNFRWGPATALLQKPEAGPGPEPQLAAGTKPPATLLKRKAPTSRQPKQMDMQTTMGTPGITSNNPEASKKYQHSFRSLQKLMHSSKSLWVLRARTFKNCFRKWMSIYEHVRTYLNISDYLRIRKIPVMTDLPKLEIPMKLW